MSVDHFRHQMQRQAAAMDSARGTLRRGLVTGVNMFPFQAKVTFQPSGAPSGWLPILSQWVGPGWGMVAALSLGDQVAIMPEDGEADHGVIVGRYYSEVDPPPEGVADGEFWIYHKEGWFLKLTAGGFVSNGPWTHTGNFNVTGIITATGDVVADNGASLVSLVMHDHISSTPGTPTSAPVPGT